MLQTALHEVHVAAGAQMVDFNGWHMPMRYSGIKDEHLRVRQAVGLFDLGHMGRLEVRGPGREALVRSLVTNDLSDMAQGQARYALLCREDGGVLDDLVVYRLEEIVFVVCNASNRERVVDWFCGHLSGQRAWVEDRTLDFAMIAVQGPRALATLGALTATDLGDIGYYHARRGQVAGHGALISRTGYTGEDGFELYVDAPSARLVWDALMEGGSAHGVLPVGLGARDTLRLEAAMPLYGHELGLEVDPLSAGLGFAVKLDSSEFLGREALRRIRSAGPARRLVCLVLDSKRVAREGFVVLHEGQAVGRVTSGTHGPTLERNIAMAYVPSGLARVGTRLQVDIRGEAVGVQVVKRPFYKRESA
ncbi:MAG: glycine cleavage system aminomethyltransferase GcvT [Planctomycetes bacterium]|nr:glycine cleavage system aminomethyltransferase GcvT [Planctomycetota bacterium]